MISLNISNLGKSFESKKKEFLEKEMSWFYDIRMFILTDMVIIYIKSRANKDGINTAESDKK